MIPYKRYDCNGIIHNEVSQSVVMTNMLYPHDMFPMQYCTYSIYRKYENRQQICVVYRETKPKLFFFIYYSWLLYLLK